MRSRGLRHLLVVLALLVLAGRGLGGDDGDVEIRPSEIKKGRDFAPREQIVSVRNPDDYRREKGILAQARHAPVLVETDYLRQRRLDMYAGTSYTESLTGQVPTVPRTSLPVVIDAEPERSRGWGGTPLAIVVPAVGFVVCLLWWRRQMKHAEASSAQLLELRQRRRARARRERHRSHVTLTPRRR